MNIMTVQEKLSKEPEGNHKLAPQFAVVFERGTKQRKTIKNEEDQGRTDTQCREKKIAFDAAQKISKWPVCRY